MQRDQPVFDTWEDDEDTPLLSEPKPDLALAIEICKSYGACPVIQRDDPFDIKSATAFNARIIMLIAALGIFVYHSMTWDHLLPIFFQDDRAAIMAGGVSQISFAGGLGMSMQEVGVILSVNGFIALFIQGFVFPFMASWLGVWKLFFVITLGHPLVYITVPYLSCLPPNLLMPGIYFCLTLRSFFAILLYPVLLILIKEASPSPSCLGKINGLAASVGAACRMLASPIAGLLYGIGIQIGFTPLAWWASAAIATVGTIQVLFIRRQRIKAARLLLRVAVDEEETPVYVVLPKNDAYVRVAEVVLTDSDSESE